MNNLVVNQNFTRFEVVLRYKLYFICTNVSENLMGSLPTNTCLKFTATSVLNYHITFFVSDIVFVLIMITGTA